MDEVTLLGHIQLLSWHLFRALHNLYDPDNSINWDDLIPPSTVQNSILPFLYKNGTYYRRIGKTSITGFNDIENYRLYELFIKEGCSTVKVETDTDFNCFPGPEEFVSSAAGRRFIRPEWIII